MRTEANRHLILGPLTSIDDKSLQPNSATRYYHATQHVIRQLPYPASSSLLQPLEHKRRASKAGLVKVLTARTLQKRVILNQQRGGALSKETGREAEFQTTRYRHFSSKMTALNYLKRVNKIRNSSIFDERCHPHTFWVSQYPLCELTGHCEKAKHVFHPIRKQVGGQVRMQAGSLVMSGSTKTMWQTVAPITFLLPPAMSARVSSKSPIMSTRTCPTRYFPEFSVLVV